jgi:excisionase family DNA binding protein
MEQVDNEHAPDHLMHPHEVAALAGVDPKTVTRWAKTGKLPHVTTLGGHRRYRESVVRKALGLDEEQVES